MYMIGAVGRLRSVSSSLILPTTSGKIIKPFTGVKRGPESERLDLIRPLPELPARHRRLRRTLPISDFRRAGSAHLSEQFRGHPQPVVTDPRMKSILPRTRA